jgi:hypothetical protein
MFLAVRVSTKSQALDSESVYHEMVRCRPCLFVVSITFPAKFTTWTR